MYTFVLSLLLSGVIAGGGYFYFTYTQDKIELQAKELITLQTTVDRQEAAIKQMVLERDATVEAMNRYATRARVAEEYQDQLLKTLHKHDLTNLVSKKPNLTGKVINEGTDKVLSDLESITQPD